MEHRNDAWEFDPRDAPEYEEVLGLELDPEMDPEIDPEELYLRLLGDEERARRWPESAWAVPGGEPLAEWVFESGHGRLFADDEAEAELAREIRLSELWRRRQDGALTGDELEELSALVGQVEGVRGSACGDCTVLERPATIDSWALAATGLCRVHLRVRIGYAGI